MLKADSRPGGALYTLKVRLFRTSVSGSGGAGRPRIRAQDGDQCCQVRIFGRSMGVRLAASQYELVEAYGESFREQLWCSFWMKVSMFGS